MVLTSWKPQWSYLKARVTSCEKWPVALCWVPNVKGTGYLRRKKEELLTFNILLSAEWNLPFLKVWFHVISSSCPCPSYFKSFLPHHFLYSLLSHETPFFLLLFNFPFIYLLISLTPPVSPSYSSILHLFFLLYSISLLSFLLVFLFQLNIYSFSTLISPYLNYSIYLQLFSFILSLIPVFFFPSSIYSSSPLLNFSFSISPSMLLSNSKIE